MSSRHGAGASGSGSRWSRTSSTTRCSRRSHHRPSARRASHGAGDAPPLSGETARRILVAIPWIVFAIAIVVLGGLVFALAMVGIGLLCLREYFLMTAPLRPLQMAAYVAVVAMIAAAYFGTAFNVLLVATASFPLLFFFAARRVPARGSSSRWA